MSIKTTRSCIDAIFDGSIDNAQFRKDDVFHFDVPTALPNIDSNILNPRNTWKDQNEYDVQYKKLGEMFAKNFEIYATDAKEYKGFGPVSE